MIVPVCFIGGPFDGLAQGWRIENPLPDKLRMSIELATSRGGIRMDVTSPSGSGALLPKEKAPDEVVYSRRDQEGTYYYAPLADDFKVIPVGT